MAYLIITDKEHELDRHELSGPVVIGRSPECDVVVRDVLLSRRHLRFEPEGRGWVVVDLGSKNGTFVDGEQIDRRAVNDADVVRAGRTRIIFRSGKFVPPPPEVVERRASRRPADPIEALSGTMMGFELTDLEESSRVTGFPIPRPKPAESSADPIEHDLKMSPRSAGGRSPPGPEWDLELREPAPAAAVNTGTGASGGSVTGASGVFGDVEPRRRRRPARSQDPSKQAATTPTWLALIYALLVYLACALALWLLSATG